MSMKTIHLLGAARYNYKGEMFLRGEVYLVGEDKAEELLDVTDDYSGFPYFEETTGAAVGKAPIEVVEEEIFKAPRKERNARRRPAPPVSQPSADMDSAEGVVQI